MSQDDSEQYADQLVTLGKHIEELEVSIKKLSDVLNQIEEQELKNYEKSLGMMKGFLYE